MSHEAVDTSAIEGEPLDRGGVQSFILRQLGFSSDHRRALPAEAGIAQMMVDLYEQASSPKCMHNLQLQKHDVMRPASLKAPGGCELGKPIFRFKCRTQFLALVGVKVPKAMI
jgi:hypothetical protein